MNEPKKLTDSLGAKAQQVAALKLEDVVNDVDFLTGCKARCSGWPY